MFVLLVYQVTDYTAGLFFFQSPVVKIRSNGSKAEAGEDTDRCTRRHARTHAHTEAWWLCKPHLFLFLKQSNLQICKLPVQSLLSPLLFVDDRLYYPPTLPRCSKKFPSLKFPAPKPCMHLSTPPQYPTPRPSHYILCLINQKYRNNHASNDACVVFWRVPCPALHGIISQTRISYSDIVWDNWRNSWRQPNSKKSWKNFGIKVMFRW